MKVVLFCGGLGIRLREYSDVIPKPMVPIGYRPILWHMMKYYAHFGHKEFILCLGYRADSIKSYFLEYNECMSNDFTLSNGGKKVELANTDLDDWQITFVDTGAASNLGQRLMAVRSYVQDDEVFLANYSDNLTDLYLPNLIADFTARDKVASFLTVRPNRSFHVVEFDKQNEVSNIVDMSTADVWINGGYFVFKNEIFDYINDGEELVCEPFRRLIGQHQLNAYKYDGFWACLDTLKDKQTLDEMYAGGKPAWEVWRNAPPQAAAAMHKERVP